MEQYQNRVERLSKFKQPSYESQCIDCNCNNCKFFIRNVEKTKLNNFNEQIIANKIHYGFCNKKQIEVSAIANICLLHTQQCFVHRKD